MTKHTIANFISMVVTRATSNFSKIHTSLICSMQKWKKRIVHHWTWLIILKWHFLVKFYQISAFRSGNQYKRLIQFITLPVIVTRCIFGLFEFFPNTPLWSYFWCPMTKINFYQFFRFFTSNLELALALVTSIWNKENKFWYIKWNQEKMWEKGRGGNRTRRTLFKHQGSGQSYTSQVL